MLHASVFCFVLCLATGWAFSQSQPGERIRSKNNAAPEQLLLPENFRCIIVGDSQSTGPGGNRLLAHTNRWDMPTVGAMVSLGNSSAGYQVLWGGNGIEHVSFVQRSMVSGWGDYGPHDFFARWGAQWNCSGDVEAPGSRLGRYRLVFGPGNTDAPWNEPWGVGNDLVAKIAVRTSPESVAMIETRPERGGVVSVADRVVHNLADNWGVKIIEQPIPAAFNPKGTEVGVGFYFPQGSVEEDGQKFEVLGVLIARVDKNGDVLPGAMVSSQGMLGWSMYDHVSRLTQASRMAMIEMIDAQQVMILLGHNWEPGGPADVEDNLHELVELWEDAFEDLGRDRPTVIHVTPWAIINETASGYLFLVEDAMRKSAREHRGDVFVSYLPWFDYLRPDVYDPVDYKLDASFVHPGNVETAKNLSQDLYEMLFEPDRVGPSSP